MMNSLLIATILTISVIRCTHGTKPADAQNPQVSGTEASVSQTSSIADTAASKTEHERFDDVWFKGSMDEALATAKSKRKLLFVYWGAVWCPPCNEIKAQVFTHPQFADLMSSVIPVYLDGDSDAAQIWGEKLKASGYPTLLLLTPDGRESMRISESLGFDEFKETINAALAQSLSFDKILTVALATKTDKVLSQGDWVMLANFSWSDSQGLAGKPHELLEARRTLADRVPAKYTEERAILAGRLLDAAAHEEDKSKETKAVVESIRKDAKTYLDRILGDKTSATAARGTLLYSAKDILEWAFGEAPSADRTSYGARWIAATEDLRSNDTLSTDTRLWAVNPAIEIFKMENPKVKDVPADLRAKVQAAVAQADREATTDFARHAAISGAGYLLQIVGDFDGGRALLTKEAERTNTPWYYQSALAGLERDAGQNDKALYWSQMASKSVQGRASKVQWIVSDLLLTTKLDQKKNQQHDRIKSLLKLYYDTAFSLSDGFAGRNGYRAKSVAKNLAPLAKKDKAVRQVIASYKTKCSKQSGPESKDACVAHFKSLL